MAYATLADLKGELGISGNADDSLLTDMLNAASDFIERFCRRRFDSWQETRYYGPAYVWKQDLLLDADLQSVTTLTNGDGTVLDDTAYWLLPRNGGGPYYGIHLKTSYSWEFADADSEIAVQGTWGYASVPDAIARACKRLATFYYRQKDAGTMGVVAVREQGQVIVPSGVPSDILDALTPFKRPRVWR